MKVMVYLTRFHSVRPFSIRARGWEILAIMVTLILIASACVAVSYADHEDSKLLQQIQQQK